MHEEGEAQSTKAAMMEMHGQSTAECTRAAKNGKNVDEDAREARRRGDEMRRQRVHTMAMARGEEASGGSKHQAAMKEMNGRSTAKCARAAKNGK